MTENPFILTLPIPAKLGEEIAVVPKEDLIWQNRKLVKEALLTLKEKIAALATEHVFAASARQLVLELPLGLFTYTKLTQSSIDGAIAFLSNEEYERDSSFRIKEAMDSIKKGLACLLRNKQEASEVEAILSLLFIL